MVVTANSPRPEILAELQAANASAKTLHASPAWSFVHERINLLLDWLVGR